MRRITAADYFVEYLIKNGVTDVFGYQGGMIAYIFDSLKKYDDKICYHSCGNEQGAAFAACSYAQASGKLGVAIATCGPGFTNMLTGIANAWFDSIPVLFLAGQVNTKDKKRNLGMRQLGFQELQAAKMSKDITKKAYDVDIDTDIIGAFDEAFRIAMSDRKGPVFFDFPINICREVLEIDEVMQSEIKKSNCDDAADLSEVIALIRSAKKPIIIAGAGINQMGYRDKFRQLTDMLQIPVVSTMPACDILPTDSKLRLGYIGGTARREAGLALKYSDLVISIGARLCSKQIGHNKDLFAPDAKHFIRVDIDENEFERKIKADEVQVKMDLCRFIDRMIENLEHSAYIPMHGSWVDACNKITEILRGYDKTEGNRIFEHICNQIPCDGNLIFDVGQNLIYGAQSAIIKEQTRVFMSAGLGSMGYAIPAAIGVSYGNKNPVYCFSGDGGTQMNIQELNTIVKNNLPIKIFVLNNRALGNIVMFQNQYLDSRIVATSENEGDYFSCNFTAIAQAYGMRAHTVQTVSEIDKYQTELYDNKPVLFNIEFEDVTLLPGIVAGGDFLNAGPAINEEDVAAIKNILGIQ